LLAYLELDDNNEDILDKVRTVPEIILLITLIPNNEAPTPT
jgi:hypothetical protein